MPVLRITVVDPPSEFLCYGQLELVLSTKSGIFPPDFISENELRFDVPLEVRPDQKGVLQGWGPAVNRQGDGRRFVYLSWIGDRDGTRGMFRRLKVFLDRVPGFPGDSETFEVRVNGKGKRGVPACATAVVAEDK